VTVTSPPSGSTSLAIGGPPRDRRLVFAGAACAALSVGAVVVRLLGLMPETAATIVVLIAAGIGLRVTMLFIGRSASGATRAQVVRLVSTVGLAVSAVTVLASLPVATRFGGMGHFVGDLLAHLWTLALLTALAGRARTFGWRVFVGIGLTGYLALPALARLVGRPLVTSLGTTSVFATAIWAPFTEELIKAVPLALIVYFAARRTASRPSAIDIALVGAWAGTGFALYENTQFARGGANWSAAVPFSLLFPSELPNHVGHSTIIAGGHLVWTALVGLGLGIGVLYGRRFARAWLAIPVTLALAVLEHGAVNAFPLKGANGSTPPLETLVRVVTLNGWLSSLLLVVGFVLVVRFESKALSAPETRADWFQLRPEVVARRGRELAVAQLRPPAPAPASPHALASPTASSS
jgi:RsiW-degrading membrane proteinase PrsW (M82 family)